MKLVVKLYFAHNFEKTAANEIRAGQSISRFARELDISNDATRTSLRSSRAKASVDKIRARELLFITAELQHANRILVRKKQARVCGRGKCITVRLEATQ